MMRFRQIRLGKAGTFVPVVALALMACVSPPLESPVANVNQTTPIRVAQNVKNKVDVLFLVDNSNSMAAMSDELRNRFDQFFAVFSDLATKGTYADLNIGVLTSDYGAGATGAPGCQQSPGGQQGKLQGIGQFAAQSCKAPLGANFLHFAFDKSGANMDNNLPMGQNQVQTFTCMASVGAMGCGFEHQLESVYAALHNNLPENAGFLRDGALLTVVFLTNEDDSSAPPDSDMFDKSKVAVYGYESSYRSTRFGVVCGPDPGSLTPYGDSTGPLSNCKAAPNPGGGGPGKEYDISRYIDFFTKPAGQGGVKTDPNDVILVAIDAPADPVQVILSNPGTPGGQPYIQCGALNESSSPPCVPVLQHSCQNPQQPVFFGDPAVRLNTVVNAAAHHGISSICDSDYKNALTSLANLIVSAIGGGCIPAKLAGDPLNPDCIVEDVTRHQDGSVSVAEIPSCATAGGAFPCWKAETKPACMGASPDGEGITVDRGGKMAPDNTNAEVSCATVGN
jgi:hypothetical protein